jgi:aryl-alcohol dehydrogenase-like predicted oxidoreductase
MQTRKLGRSGLEVSEIGLGSWLTLGNRIDVSGTTALVRQAYDRGINFFDTADVYAKGAAEECLGQAIQQLSRHHLVLATKCYFAMSDHPNDHGLSRKHIFESVEASLRRLGTDYLDLHQCHRPDPTTPIEETVRAYDDLIRQGKLLYWGVSEWSVGEIAQACAIADEYRAHRPVSNQPNYSIMRRGIEQGTSGSDEGSVLEVSAHNGLGQVVFSPLGQGALTGKYSGGARPEGSRAMDDLCNRWMGDYLSPDAVARVDRLQPLAAKLDISMAQLALAWCLRTSHVSSVIVGVTRQSQLDDNVAASGIELPAEVIDEIDAIFPASAER